MSERLRRADQASAVASRSCRIALYSHDTMGIGHLRRNLLIAEALAGPSLRATILLVAGAREAAVFPLPPATDILTLPSLHKQSDGRYRPRSLDIPLAKLLRLRSEAIHSAICSFAPDVLIADKVPRGVGGELEAAIAGLRSSGSARLVLGLRDILDEPEAVQREWSRMENEQFIQENYDSIWIYGDRSVYDPAAHYSLRDSTRAKIQFTGYLNPKSSLVERSRGHEPIGDPLPSAGRLVLCVLGGGQDGGRLAEAFSKAPLPDDTSGVLITGPFMPRVVRERLRREARHHPRFRVVDFVAEPGPLLQRADRVITMGGYNTLCEVLCLGKSALVVPRVMPRKEQLIRATRLQELGLVELLHPRDLTPEALGLWMARETPSTPASSSARVDLGGLRRLPHLVCSLLTADRVSHKQPRLPLAIEGAARDTA